MARRYPRREITARREHFQETEAVLSFFQQEREEPVKLWDAETGATEALETMTGEGAAAVTVPAEEDLDCPILRGMCYGIALSMVLLVIAHALVIYCG